MYFVEILLELPEVFDNSIWLRIDGKGLEIGCIYFPWNFNFVSIKKYQLIYFLTKYNNFQCLATESKGTQIIQIYIEEKENLLLRLPKGQKLGSGVV